jgi:hypothetical protein
VSPINLVLPSSLLKLSVSSDGRLTKNNKHSKIFHMMKHDLRERFVEEKLYKVVSYSMHSNIDMCILIFILTNFFYFENSDTNDIS